jgi:hypothetical protein
MAERKVRITRYLAYRKPDEYRYKAEWYNKRGEYVETVYTGAETPEEAAMRAIDQGFIIDLDYT